MLRSKPTCIALTEDDLRFHIDSIFSRNEQLVKWHQQRTGSGNSYDGDEDDEDGLFLESDSFSPPETLFESECDETQSQTMAGSGPLEQGEERDSLDDNNLRDKAYNGSQQWGLQSARDAHPHRNSLDLMLQTSQHNHSESLFNTAPLPPSDDGDETSILARLLANLFLELTGHTCAVNDSGNPRLISSFLNSPQTGRRSKGLSNTTILEHPPSDLSGLHLVPLKAAPSSAQMEYPDHTGSSSAGKEPHETVFDEMSIFEAQAQEFLAAPTSDQGSLVPQLSPIQGSSIISTERNDAPPDEVDAETNKDQDTSDLVYQNTLQATHASQHLLESDNEQTAALQSQLESQENIAPERTTGQPPSRGLFQDPFISAMFPDSGTSDHDTTDQYCRIMEGHGTLPPKQGRRNHNSDGPV
ncbi:hypothetical protein BJY04DRAFT_195427 [Aspergillus karnatakaensis]|uniref:uncharacterized protein n=1 Tax=Aspergillus karnatakaensis TaxID=1810916 RepID=UPI003CCCBEC3